MSISLDTAQANLGDSVEVTVVATDAGPLTAGGAEVEATVPAALTFVAGTQTVGSFDSGTSVWSLGDLAPGAADTLRLTYEVTDGTPGTLSITAQSLGLVLEVDPVNANDQAGTTLGVS